jgi:hypothetical protein
MRCMGCGIHASGSVSIEPAAERWTIPHGGSGPERARVSPRAPQRSKRGCPPRVCGPALPRAQRM